MKKVIILLTTVIFAQTASAQITPVGQNDTTQGITAIQTAKTIATYDNKDTWLQQTISASGDTTYAIRLRTTYSYDNAFEVMTGAREKSHLLISLGPRQQAIAIVRSMINFKGEPKTLVSLNNPSENVAMSTSDIRGRGFAVTDKYSIEREWVSVRTLEKILTDIIEDTPGTEQRDVVADQQQAASYGLIAAVVVGIGVAIYFILSLGK